jgi:hypothetical protein
MGRTRPLSLEVLDRLQTRWRAAGAQPVEPARLPADEISAATAAFAGELPVEARLWWSRWGQGGVLPAVQYVSPSDAIREYAFRQREAARLCGSFEDLEPDEMWHPGWLPIFAIDGGMVIAIDSTLSDGLSAPLRLIDWQDLGGSHFARIVAGSLGDYITDTLDAIDAGSWTYDATLRRWRRDGTT